MFGTRERLDHCFFFFQLCEILSSGGVLHRKLILCLPANNSAKSGERLKTDFCSICIVPYYLDSWNFVKIFFCVYFAWSSVFYRIMPYLVFTCSTVCHVLAIFCKRFFLTCSHSWSVFWKVFFNFEFYNFGCVQFFFFLHYFFAMCPIGLIGAL